MEKLNEYLQKLLSTCSYELHLEPNRQPFVISDKGATELASVPLLGTQISMLIFPLIPAAVKQELPNKTEVEFVHKHNLGTFNFHVKKSPAGFNVTIRPLLSDSDELQQDYAAPENLPETFGGKFAAKPETDAQNSESSSASSGSSAPLISAFSNAPSQENILPTLNTQSFSFDEVSPTAKIEPTPDFFSNREEIQVEANEYQTENSLSAPLPEIEIVPIDEPEFTTAFSDTSTYEPPLRRQEFASEYETQPPIQTQFFSQAEPSRQVTAETPMQAPAFVPADINSQLRRRMDSLFYKMAEAGASDLHMSVSVPPMIRKDGKMRNLETGEPPLAPEAMKELLSSIMPDKNREEFALRRDTDFAYEIEGLARFRANIFMDRKGMGGVFRIIPSKILTAEDLNLSKAILDLCSLSKGLVVVTGPTGSGKSTTLCAMVDYINRRREEHLITIEDPIEFVHDNKKCLVNQREVHNHTESFKDALRAALREDPDIVLVGEMRDLETIAIAIETAETGHLVFGTLHTTTAASTIDRIIDQFPADRQQQIRVMLSESLKGVIAQTLLPKKGGGRIAALEVLIVTPAISNLIREGKTFQIPSAMQTGKTHGMIMLNDALFDLVEKDFVEPRDAYIKAVDKTNFEALLNRNGMKI